MKYAAFITFTVMILIPRQAAMAQFPLSLENRKAGISMSLTGANGSDWAVERTFHNDSIADQIIYLRSSVDISLAHNERNSIMMSTPRIPRVVGAGDQPDVHGEIRWKIDRDGQAHNYAGGGIPDFAPRYERPFRFDTLTYDGQMKVLGAIGDNGGAFGNNANATRERFAYGQRDAFGNEWHTLTYWDNDIPLYQKAGVSPHRQGASDGHAVFICVNPVTPVIQLHAPDGQQFYTSPIKTYHIPRIWRQTTYLTSGVVLSFVNLTNDQPIEYRVGDGAFQRWAGQPLRADALGLTDNQPAVLEVRNGPDGAVLQRDIVLNPDYPAPDETHGYLLWADDAGKAEMKRKVTEVEPFVTSWRTFTNDYYQRADAMPTDTRGGWRATAGMASTTLNNALVAAVEGPEARPEHAAVAKARLLHMFRLQPVGFEISVTQPTPSKDYFNELSQTMQQFADAAVAYDLLVSCYRASDHAGGITPIEEHRIRDGLGELVKTLLQVRDNNSATSGAGDTHWGHGYELVIGITALAMPTYQTPYYGTSGGDRATVPVPTDDQGKYHNPFPDQPVTWYQAATDPRIPTPGFPNVVQPFRAEFLLSSDGWWTGPNDLVADGDRYYTGPRRRQLADIKSGGLANADARVELIEMGGYESPFVSRLYVMDHIRRLRGDHTTTHAVKNYLQRRLVHGVVSLRWDSDERVYHAGQPHVHSALEGFNIHNPYAQLPSAHRQVSTFLHNLNVFYGNAEGELDADTRRAFDGRRKVLYDAYTLALCADPTTIATVDPSQRENTHTPIIKPMFKHVVRPGQKILKKVIAMDLDDQPLTLSATGLPDGASFDATSRTITWSPGEGDVGVHIAHVTADDGKHQVTRPFPMIVMREADRRNFPPRVDQFTASLIEDNQAVRLAWQPPADAEDIACYFIYRDGALWATVPAGTHEWVDRQWIATGQNTRYHLATVNTVGGESAESAATPAMVRY